MGRITVFDHNHECFTRAKPFENGAATYSADIIRYQLHRWEAALPQDMDVTLYTALPPNRLGFRLPDADLSITYLHTHPVRDCLAPIRKAQDYDHASLRVYVTAYYAYHCALTAAGYHSAYVPMSIAPMARREIVPHDKRMIWFGNVYHSKRQTLDRLRTACKKAGWKLDVISRGKFNDRDPVTREHALDIIAQYPYGAGVGRCAMEMQAMGMKVLIAGDDIGGLIMDENDRQQQIKTNHNARLATFSRDIDLCLDTIQHSLQVEPLTGESLHHPALIAAQLGWP